MVGVVLFEALEEEELLLGSPFVVVEGVVELVDDVILGGVVIEVGEATHAVVAVLPQDLGALADVPFALVALRLVGGVQDVLRYQIQYVEVVTALLAPLLPALRAPHLLPRLLVALDQKFPTVASHLHSRNCARNV